MDNDKFADESLKDDCGRQKAPQEGGCSSGCGCGSPRLVELQGRGDCEGGGCGCDGEDAEGEMKVDFFNYIMSMAYQTMIFLGEAPNPVTGESQKNLRQAKFLIDTIQLIQEKTRGNLNKEEDAFLGSSLYELQMKYVEASSKAN